MLAIVGYRWSRAFLGEELDGEGLEGRELRSIDKYDSTITSKPWRACRSSVYIIENHGRGSCCRDGVSTAKEAALGRTTTTAGLVPSLFSREMFVLLQQLGYLLDTLDTLDKQKN